MSANGQGHEESLTTVERKSDRELVVTRSFNAPLPIVYEAWTKPENFSRWWSPKSFGLTIVSCEMDVRDGGAYRLMIRHKSSEQPMAFFGRYFDVVPYAHYSWTNDEGGEGGAITTVSFEDKGDKTLVVLRDLYPSKKALDDAIASQATSGFDETFTQLDEFLVVPG